MADLDARAGLAKQRITILEQELDASQSAAKELQAQLGAQKSAASAERDELQVWEAEMSPRLDLAEVFPHCYCCARCEGADGQLRLGSYSFPWCSACFCCSRHCTMH